MMASELQFFLSSAFIISSLGMVIVAIGDAVRLYYSQNIPDSGVRALFMMPTGVRDSELADGATGRIMARWLRRGRLASGRSGFVCGCTLS